MQNLELEVTSGADGTYRVAARSEAGDTQDTPTRFPFDEQTLERRLLAVELALVRSAASLRRMVSAEEQQVLEFGRELFQFLFPPGLSEHLAAMRDRAAREGVQLQVRLRIRPPELAALPWEFLYDAARDEYMCLSAPFVRYVEVLEPLRPLAATPPLRILGMVARPGGLSSLNVDHERRRLEQALAPLERTGGVQLSWVTGQTWQDLQDALDEDDWHIFHFIGHGGFDRKRGEGVLALADEDGVEYPLAASDLGLLLGGRRSVRLVVLNSCESARANARDVFSSTAAVLIRRGIPAVVAMQYDISDKAAIAFAQGLYGAVANRQSVDHAVTRARLAIKLSARDSLEWATPVLYLRSRDADLFELTRTPVLAEVIKAEQQRRSSVPKRDIASEVLHTDVTVSSQFPEKTLQSIRNQRQPIRSQLARMKQGPGVLALAFSPDGSRLAAGSYDGRVRVWEASSGEELAHIKHGGWVQAVAFSPDGAQVATGGSDDTVRLWDASSGEELVRVEHRSGVLAVAFSPDGGRLATGSYDGTARLWDRASGEELVRMEHGGGVLAVAFSPDGAQVATGGSDDTVRLWDASSGEELVRVEHRSGVLAVAFSPDGGRLATGSYDGTARLWDRASGEELVRMEHGGGVLAVAFSPDGVQLATGSYDEAARLWEASSGSELARMEHGSPVLAVAFSIDGVQLVTGSSYKTARLWTVNIEQY